MKTHNFQLFGSIGVRLVSVIENAEYSTVSQCDSHKDQCKIDCASDWGEVVIELSQLDMQQLYETESFVLNDSYVTAIALRVDKFCGLWNTNDR